MRDIPRYQGIIPASYACYDDEGAISPERVGELTRHIVRKGVRGLYADGFSGECIYRSVNEYKLVLKHVVKAAEGKLTITARMDRNSTVDSVKLAAHAQSLGVGAAALIPPVYFHLPEYAVAEYWSDISSTAPDTGFVIYNIPQLAGVALTMPLFREMLKNPGVMTVKNSSMPVQDIRALKMDGGEGFVVFNGPDERLVSGLIMGVGGGVGRTYRVMLKLYIKIMELVEAGDISRIRDIQSAVDGVIYKICSRGGNLYVVMKEILNVREGLKLGSVRKLMLGPVDNDMPCVKECVGMVGEAIKKYR